MEERWIIKIGKLDLEYLDGLLNKNVWKAFTTIHAGIHQQMKTILVYKFKKHEEGVAFGAGNSEKSKFLKDRRFFELMNYLFVTGIIEEGFRKKIEDFNIGINKKLAHIDVYEKTETSDEDIKKLCLDGIEIIKELDKILQEIFFGKIIINH